MRVHARRFESPAVQMTTAVSETDPVHAHISYILRITTRDIDNGQSIDSSAVIL